MSHISKHPDRYKAISIYAHNGASPEGKLTDSVGMVLIKLDGNSIDEVIEKAKKLISRKHYYIYRIAEFDKTCRHYIYIVRAFQSLNNDTYIESTDLEIISESEEEAIREAKIMAPKNHYKLLEIKEIYGSST